MLNNDLTVKIKIDFFVNILPVLPGKGSPIQKPAEEVSDIDLKYNYNNITFNFAATDYREPDAAKYFTKLEGYDRKEEIRLRIMAKLK
jgi:hypothetical protein